MQRINERLLIGFGIETVDPAEMNPAAIAATAILRRAN
jgi:hypothetical protein